MKFEAVVMDIKRRKRGDKEIAVVTVRYDGGKFPVYSDLEYPADETPIVSIGQDIGIEVKFPPSARGYISKKINPNTGEAYVNGVPCYWKPVITGGDAPAPEPRHVEAQPDDEEIPF